MADVVSTWQASRKLGVYTSTVRRMIHRGDFPNAFKVGRVWRIPRQEVTDYIEQAQERARSARTART